MNWKELFAAITAWIQDGSGVTCVEHVDSARSFDDAVFCEYFVSQVQEIGGELNGYRNTDTGALVVQGQLEVTLTVAFVSHSQAPDEFALQYSELLRVRSKLPAIRNHLKALDHSPVVIGPTTYLQEERDDHIFSRAEYQARFRVWVDYADDTGGTLEPVEQIETTTDMGTTAPGLQLDEERIPPD